jgi:hypothetical protein
LMILAPTSIDGKGNASWTPMGIDDSWIQGDPLDSAIWNISAWGAATNQQAFVDASKRMYQEVQYTSICLLGDTAMDTVVENFQNSLNYPPAALPNLQHTTDGICVARTGSGTGIGTSPLDMTVLLKNTPTIYDDPPNPTTIPALDTHGHNDHGNVVAYRGCEPVLIDPGYGINGSHNSYHNSVFANWLYHNVPLMLGAGYNSTTKNTLGCQDNYMVMTRPLPSTEYRNDQATTVTSEKGSTMYTLRSDLQYDPQWTRFVFMPSSLTPLSSLGSNNTFLVIVDRLATAAELKLCWWGYGDATPYYAGSGSPTFRIDTSQSIGAFVWNHAVNSPIRMVSQLGTQTYGAYGLTQVEGRYGPCGGGTYFNGTSWDDLPITGVWLFSGSLASPVAIRYTATVVEIGTGTWQNLTPEIYLDGGGGIHAVGVNYGPTQTLLDSWGIPT